MIICNLKSILEDRGISQRALAEEVLAHEATISNLCNNKFKRVDVDLLNAICDFLDIKLSELLLYRRDYPGK